MTEIPQHLLDNPRQHRPTEILVPIRMGIGPSVRHSDPPLNGWYARLDIIDIGLDVDSLWQCDHDHPTEATAWLCAEDAATQLAEAVLDAR